MVISYCRFAENPSELKEVILGNTLALVKGQSEAQRVDPHTFYMLSMDIEFLYGVIEFLIRVDEGYEILRIFAEDLENSVLRYQLISPEKLIGVLDLIIKGYQNIGGTRITKLSSLNNEEKSRINEAWHSFREGCFWSCVINCAVTLESRLFLILKRRNLSYLKSIKSDLRFTFGKLIETYLKNSDKFKDCIPLQHGKLLSLVNSYRILSAHAKQFRVDKHTASAVFDLTLSFLFDEKCQPPKKRGPKR